ncbi:MAG: DUF4864 domain-containing protein [Rhodospirillaceae bacterium]|nr:DUF4864 domain-containing protein [Rhodospirillaceae bacterium]
MSLVRLVGLIVVALGLHAAAHATAPSDIDPALDPSVGIRTAIEEQLAAFNRNDLDAAFSYAAPQIQNAFETADAFAAMVEKDYQAIHRSKGAVFLELRRIRNHFVQRVRLRGADDAEVDANYVMIRRNDGAWRIAGVTLSAQPAKPKLTPLILKRPPVDQ